MMESSVEIKCMKVDLDIVKEVLEEATKEFSELMKKETAKDIKTKLNLNESDFLDKDNKNAFFFFFHSASAESFSHLSVAELSAPTPLKKDSK